MKRYYSLLVAVSLLSACGTPAQSTTPNRPSAVVVATQSAPINPPDVPSPATLVPNNRTPQPAPTAAIPLNHPITLEEPSGATAILPLQIAFRGAQGNETLTARLRFATGDSFEQQVTASQGYGLLTMNWNTESRPPTLSGPATLAILHADGSLAAQRQLTIQGEDATQTVRIAWLGGEEVVLAHEAVLKTSQIGAAALNRLLFGPTQGNLAGFTSALPSVQEVMSYAGRQADWDYRVRLHKLTITDGVATANFSRELQAYGGGAARAQAIRSQIEQTLRQFPAVKQVVIAIEGQTEGILQP